MTFKVIVEPSGLAFDVKPGQNVLDAALEADIVLPYSCRGGGCSTCKGKVLEGDYEAGEAPLHILEQDELEQGYTLMCQAVPKTDLRIESPQARLATDIQIRKMPVRVMKREQINDDVMRLLLQLPPGQPFMYYAGQYLDVLLKDGRRRSYSMANPPREDNTIELHLRHMPGGLFTDHVFGVTEPAMKERAILRVEAPFGSFFLREESQRPMVLLASGTGFAPIKALVEDMQQKNIQRPVRLYWGGRRPKDIYMMELAQQWAQELKDFAFTPVVSDALAEDNWTGRTGFVHHAVMEDLPDLSGWEVYACGAPIMVESAQKDFVEKCGLDEALFYADAFTSEADLVS
ncbi:CDP-6-deoxy-delta-3,4-glucoseen reductase [Paenalcaligenes sp.]|uniref:CDP-6-deoxy-delta-3,4-glucoseen reductase n=1 Tax=Paenalcaligenes sp. TaxID=1966342 RepID=UPI00260F0740|nr:CDP-6-deoxy-delta-3,4-glucoseen reductase [Paenalcaligenes sp.]